MAIHKLFFITLFFIQPLFFFFLIPSIRSTNSNLFREYIGAEFRNVTFTDVPINSAVEFHFILSFAIDYTENPSSPSHTDGNFNIFWDKDNLTPSKVSSIKRKNPNVKVAVSLGGDTVGNNAKAFFKPSSIDSWVSNAVTSLSSIINRYHLDGIDIDYEHFKADPKTFARCVGRLISTLKKNGVISFASIAPYNDDQVQRYYLALWKRYGHLIDYVNFQFYAYNSGITVPQFLHYYKKQSANYYGGKVLVSLSTETDPGGLTPENGFFKACRILKRRQKLNGIFVWSADDSKARGFPHEGKLQSLLAISH